MTGFKYLFLIFILNTIVANGQNPKIPDYVSCADPKCSVPVSLAKTKLHYNSPTVGVLSFPKDKEVTIYSKSRDLWGAEFNGKRGFVPQLLVKEIKILSNQLTFNVSLHTKSEPQPDSGNPTSESQTVKQDTNKQESNNENSKLEISPDFVIPPHEVIDGTTIYNQPPMNDPNLNVQSTTESITQSPKNIFSTESTIEPTLSVVPDPKTVHQNIQSSTEKLMIDKLDDPIQQNDEELDENVEENSILRDTATKLLSNVGSFLYDQFDTKNSEQDLGNNKLDKNEEITSEEMDNIEKEISHQVLTENIDKKQINTNSNQENENIEQNTDIKSKQDPILNLVNLEMTSIPPFQNSDANIQNTNVEPPKENMRIQEYESQENFTREKENKENFTKEDESLEKSIKENFTNVLQSTKEILNEKQIVSENIKEDTRKSENLVDNENNVSETPATNQSIAQNEDLIKTEDKIINTLEDLQDQKDKTEEFNINVNEQNVPSNIISFLGNSGDETKSGLNLNKVPDNLDISASVSSEPGHFVSTTDATISEISMPPPSTQTEPVITENPINIAEKNDQNLNVDESEKIIENVEVSETVESETEQENKDAVKSESNEKIELDEISNNEPGFFINIYNSIFGSNDGSSNTDNNINEVKSQDEKSYSDPLVNDDVKTHTHERPFDKYLDPSYQSPKNGPKEGDQCELNEYGSECISESIQPKSEEPISAMEVSMLELPGNLYTLLLCMIITAITILVFCLGHYYIEKHRQDGTLISNINSLEKKLLVASKENLIIQDELNASKQKLLAIEDSSFGSNEMVSSLKLELEQSTRARSELEEQVANLEKELENATEAGMELNRMLTEFLSSQQGNENVMEQVEYLQKQLMEQQITINSMNSKLAAKNTEYELLHTEITVANNKNIHLQSELDQMVINILSVQEEKTKNETEFEAQTKKIKETYDVSLKSLQEEIESLKGENQRLKNTFEENKRTLQLKTNEYDLLQQSMSEVQLIQSNKESLAVLLDISKVKAEVQQLRDEKHSLTEKLKTEKESKFIFEKQIQVVMQEMKLLKDKFEEAEKEKVEAQTRLEVLSGYFKQRETQMQKEINEQESMWVQKQGEATSTIERIKWIQEELQNYKSQNEGLKKEILDQEVSLKSQISMLEKKSHDNWVLARQAERRLEETKQEASQLRNRLTIVEKNLNNSSQLAEESKNMNRIMSPLEANGDMSVSPLHMGNMEAPGSPPLLFQHRDPSSPPLPPGLPPFMPPPPPGVPFSLPPGMPPIPGGPPFMPPPPPLFPGDHRPPPLGRMSSPPLHGRYSNDSRVYSPYERDDSPPLSPMYSDDNYRRRPSPPPMNRPYSPYKERDYRGSKPVRNKPRTHKGSGLSSNSGNSNESLENTGRQSGRV